MKILIINYIFHYSNKKYNENIITTPKKIIEKILI